MILKNRLIEYIIIFLATIYAAVFILGLSFINPTGYMSGDSSNYLRLSGRILEGHGFFLPSNGREGADEKWFAIWPVGYPLLISGVAWVLGISTFLASKILNIFLLFFAILALYLMLGRKGLIASFILLTASTLRNYTMTWSEAPFLTALIVLCLYLGKIINGDFKVNNQSVMILFSLLILPFLFRYVGLFVIAPVFLVAINLFIQDRKRESILILIAIFFSLIFCLLYLVNNFQLTGYATGMPRPPANEENYIFLVNLLKSIFQEFILIMPSWDISNIVQNIVVIIWSLFTLFCILSITKKSSHQKESSNIDIFSYLFMIFGLIYLCAIIFLRWISNFSELGLTYRLLNPGFALFFIGLCLWILEKKKEKLILIVTFALVTVLFVAVGNFYSIIIKHGLGANYLKHIETIKEEYSSLPDNAVVVFGDRELKYLRPNIKIATPKRTSDKISYETWDNFLLSLDASLPIFVETRDRSKKSNFYHKSVNDAINALPEKKILQIRKPSK